MRQRAKFRRNQSNRCWNIAICPFFQDGGRPPFWILWGKFWDDPQREFDGLYHYAKFGSIAFVVLITQKFEYFARLVRKRLLTPILGLLCGKNRGKWAVCFAILCKRCRATVWFQPVISRCAWRDAPDYVVYRLQWLRTRLHFSSIHCRSSTNWRRSLSLSYARNITLAWFLARDVIYRLHLLWRKCIVVTVHAGKRGGVISRYASHC